MIRVAAHDHDVSSFGALEWVLVALASLAVIWVIWRAVVLTVRPGEEDPKHIKRTILLDAADEAAPGPPGLGEDGPPSARGGGAKHAR